MQKKLTFLYVFLAIIFIGSITFKPYVFSWAIKLIPILLLIGFAWKNLKISKLSNRFFILGLTLSACGDFILDYNRGGWFIYGLAAFFIAHIFYLISLVPYIKNLYKKRYLTALLGYIIYGFIMYTLLADHLGALFIPVLGYMSILLLMALATVFSEKSNYWLIIGGISFVISDSLIGIDKFYLPILHSHVIIMISYYFAQYALLRGFVERSKSNH